jgi:translation elongation factor EF-4
MKLCEDRRGTYKKTEYIGATRVLLTYEAPARGKSSTISTTA